MSRNNKSLNIERLKLIQKGYVNQRELGIFLDVGKSKASTIYKEISNNINSQGKSVDCLGIRVCHVLDYIGLTEKDVRRFAEDEINRQGAN